jgi:phosphatidylinositol 4-kinase
LVAVPFESLTPASISTGTETWTWLVRERPDLEISLMLEFNAAWLSTIELKKGMFSSALKFVYLVSPSARRILI